MQRKNVRGRSFCGEKGFCLQVLVPLSSRLLALLVKKMKMKRDEEEGSREDSEELRGFGVSFRVSRRRYRWIMARGLVGQFQLEIRRC